MAVYDTRFGLPQTSVDYLNQGLPSISNIFQSTPIQQAAPVVEEQIQVDTDPALEKLKLLLAQNQVGRDGGRDNITPINTTNNAGIYSFSDITDRFSNAFDAVKERLNPGSFLSVINPFLGLAGTYVYDKFQKQKAAKEAAAKEAFAAQAEARRSAIAQEAANRDYIRNSGNGGGGSRRGDSDISDSQRGGYATDDTAGFF